MTREDYEQAPCTCPICRQAGVHMKPQIRDRYTGAWLHGYDLKRWHDARDQFWTEWDAFRKQIKAMR